MSWNTFISERLSERTVCICLKVCRLKYMNSQRKSPAPPQLILTELGKRYTFGERGANMEFSVLPRNCSVCGAFTGKI